MPELTCPECGGPMASRTSGFQSCVLCGKLIVTPKANDDTLAGQQLDALDQIRDNTRHIAESAGLTPTTKPDPGSDVVVPDYFECQVGWRAWGVDPRLPAGGVPLLRSVSHKSSAWTPCAPMEAVCGKKAGLNPDHVPGNGCGCGLYSAKTLQHLMSMAYHKYDADRRGLFHVVGSVNLWGRIVEGTQGWRAQFGYPRELFVPFEAWQLVEPLAEAYRVPVKLKNVLGLEHTPEEASA